MHPVEAPVVTGVDDCRDFGGRDSSHQTAQKARRAHATGENDDTSRTSADSRSRPDRFRELGALHARLRGRGGRRGAWEGGRRPREKSDRPPLREVPRLPVPVPTSNALSASSSAAMSVCSEAMASSMSSSRCRCVLQLGLAHEDLVLPELGRGHARVGIAFVPGVSRTLEAAVAHRPLLSIVVHPGRPSRQRRLLSIVELRDRPSRNWRGARFDRRASQRRIRRTELSDPIPHLPGNLTAIRRVVSDPVLVDPLVDRRGGGLVRGCLALARSPPAPRPRTRCSRSPERRRGARRGRAGARFEQLSLLRFFWRGRSPSRQRRSSRRTAQQRGSAASRASPISRRIYPNSPNSGPLSRLRIRGTTK